MVPRQKCPFHLGRSRLLSNTWFHGPTWVSSPNGISICSAVFAQTHRQANTQTDKHSDHATRNISSNRPYLRTACRRCGLKSKDKGTPYSLKGVHLPFLDHWAYKWIYHRDSDAWTIRRQTHGYLSSSIALPLILCRYAFSIPLRAGVWIGPSGWLLAYGDSIGYPRTVGRSPISVLTGLDVE